MRRDLAKALAPYVLGVALAGGWFATYTVQQRKVGALAYQLADAKKSERLATIEAERLAKQYRVDTVRLTRTRRVTDSIFTHSTDTLIHRDTVVRYLERERLACDAVISTCERRLAASDSVTASLRAQIKTMGDQKPSKLRRALTLVGVGLGGYVAGRVVP